MTSCIIIGSCSCFIFIIFKIVLKLCYISSNTSARQVLQNKITLSKLLFFLIFQIIPSIQFCYGLSGGYLVHNINDYGYLGNYKILVYCSLYPVVQGILQNVNIYIDYLGGFDLKLLTAALSILYSSLPYKLIFLAFTDPLVVTPIIIIKITYKLFGYILRPIITQKISSWKKGRKIQQNNQNLQENDKKINPKIKTKSRSPF